MDIQTRKLNFIQEFLKIQNEDVLSQFEKLLHKEKSNISERNLSPMSVEEFNKRIDLSLADSENNKTIEINDLLNEISKWH
ncbi:MAG: hypothetical protein JW798_15725 [Prolixibacteraceae bacterium]|nr:hypothetical protein [Prolixibacteraceae bacterium]